ncbi:hypothetical protein B566_EDAN017527, partial [Ephemera danica]
HNDDGSYTYGFEGADGTFKIETKFANGDVKGKYGFVDDTGKVRTVEYGADRYGFQPAGEGITVAPPTLVDESLTEEPEFDDFRPRPVQQRVQQRVKAAPRPQPQSRPQQFQPRPQQQQQPQYQPQYEEGQYEQQGPAPGANFQQQTTFSAAPHYEVQEAPEHARRPAPVPKRPLSIPGAAPVPQRPVAIPGAIPAPVRSSAPARPAQFQGAFQAPDPVRPRAQPQQHSPRAGPQQQHQQHHQQQPQQFFQPQPAPQAFHQPAPQQARAFQAPRAAHGSVLDQLAKDYALPQGGSAATHDITFSSGF